MPRKMPTNDPTRMALRAVGLRATPARVAVLDLLSQSRSPVSHLEVDERLRGAAIDKSTIYRALQDIVQSGLARRLDLGDHVWRYERLRTTPQSDRRGALHPHLVCVDCGEIICLTEGQVKLDIASSVGPIEDVLLKGRCGRCAES
jgi:Fur family ferric uptake transcriptional regulator